MTAVAGARRGGMRPLMVLGCTSDAGKSLLVTALCRWFARQGVVVAPYKAQNMSNNARVVEGGEIGVAQWLQARSAGIRPEVAMNPVLVKPESDTTSQVVVRGRVDRDLTARGWSHRHDALWEPMAASLDDLVDRFELVVIEGAGSPAEINLRDQVNNRVIDHADARGVLVSDIDRGGSFAHLFGTWSLVPPPTQRRLAAFVLNRFRGDPALLAPGPARLQEMTAMSPLGVLPMLDHDLPREEGFAAGASSVGSPNSNATVAIPRLPYGSNLDEFQPLSTVADMSWTTSGEGIDRLDPTRDLVILPGSKHVAADLSWLRASGLATAITAAARRGVRTIGVCGGAMMLGRTFSDPDGVEGPTGPRSDRVATLDLLPLDTILSDDKHVGTTMLRFGGREGVGERFEALAGLTIEGYEIRNGSIRERAGVPSTVAGRGTVPVAWASGNVLATTVHGLFEDPSFVAALFGVAPPPTLERTFDLLADAVERHLDTDQLLRLVGG